MPRHAPLAMTLALMLLSPACGGNDVAEGEEGGSDSGDGDTGDGDGDGDTGDGDGDGDTGDGDGDTGDGDGDTGDTGDGDGDGDGDGGFTWTNGASEFFETYCWECHGPGDSLRDYSQLADVMVEANTIRCGVAATQQDNCAGEPPPKQFPIGNNLPTDAEREMIVAWIDAGMPE